MIGDAERRIDISADVLRLLYDLTDAEARLFNRLVKGCSVREIADAFGITETTIRTQLKHLLNKTGARRQSELVRMALTGPALFTCRTDEFMDG